MCGKTSIRKVIPLVDNTVFFSLWTSSFSLEIITTHKCICCGGNPYVKIVIHSVANTRTFLDTTRDTMDSACVDNVKEEEDGS